MNSPFPFLTPAVLRGLWAAFEADPAIESFNFERGGVTTIVRQRDLAFIHEIDAARFGTSAECPICVAEVAALDGDFTEFDSDLTTWRVRAEKFRDAIYLHEVAESGLRERLESLR